MLKFFIDFSPENSILYAVIDFCYGPLEDMVVKNKVVEGFSARFQILCQLAGFPNKYGVIEKLSARTGTKASTLKTWYRLDAPPLTGTMKKVVEILLKDIPGDYKAQLVTAWIYFGEGSDFPCPFGEKYNKVEMNEESPI